jgi:SAM-dependent methyltransferase
MAQNEAGFWKSFDDARQYDEYTKTSFARIYPLLATQILSRTGITQGLCLDAGCGPAPLAIALTLQSNLRVIAMDSSPIMQPMIALNVQSSHFDSRIFPLLGDVHKIPVPDGTFDLVVSRGSYHFWHDLPQALREICRVIKPGGVAYIGGGYGSNEVRSKVIAWRKERGIIDDPHSPSRPRFRKYRTDEISAILIQTHIRRYSLIDDESGFWILIHV